MTEGKKHELSWAKTLKLPKRSFLVFDKAFTDYQWFQDLINRGFFFVTRQKKDACYEVIANRRIDKNSGVISDQTIRLTA